jgi:hypothetical protein
MLDWLDAVNVVFITAENDRWDWSLVIQTSLTILAALLGGLTAYAAQLMLERSRQNKKLNSLAISIIYKVSKAANMQRFLIKTFYSAVPEDTPKEKFWHYVLSCPEIPEEVWQLSNEEFEFLLGDGDEPILAYNTVAFLGYALMNLRSLNQYFRELKSLHNRLDPFIIEVDTSSQTISREYSREEHPELYRLELETGMLCYQVYENLNRALEDARKIMIEANSRLPSLTKNANFPEYFDSDSLNIKSEDTSKTDD